jgi:hypothetical protein
MITAGQAREDGQWAFWDVRDPEQAVIIHLADERYARLVIEVDGPMGERRQHQPGAHGRPRPRPPTVADAPACGWSVRRSSS